MTIKNVVIGTMLGKKQRDRKIGSTNKNKIAKLEKIVKTVDNPAWDYFDGSNTGTGIDPLDKLLSGKKLIWKTKYRVFMTGLKDHGPEETERYFNPLGTEKSKGKYVSPDFVVKNIKTKEEIFRISANFGEGFVKLCDYLNNL